MVRYAFEKTPLDRVENERRVLRLEEGRSRGDCYSSHLASTKSVPGDGSGTGASYSTSVQEAE